MPNILYLVVISALLVSKSDISHILTHLVHSQSSEMAGKSMPLKGKLVCVTVNVSTREGDPISPSDSVSYNDMKIMVEELGGKISSTVHKKVDYLVASENAVRSATQRVRKAHKFSVPVVRMSLVDYCYVNRSIPSDMTKYQYSNIAELIMKYKENVVVSALGDGEVTEEGRTKAKRKANAACVPVEAFEFKSSEVFECGCICHDRGELSCSWCEGAHVAHDVNQTEKNEKTDAGVTKKQRKCPKEKNYKA